MPFAINATNSTFSVSLFDDNVLEGNERFTLTIDPSSKLPDDVKIGVTNEATVIIVDDDCKYM